MSSPTRGDAVTLPWVLAAAAAGVIAGPRIRASVFSRSTESGQPPRRACPACTEQILPDRWPWRSLLPVTGRCPSCRARIGPYPLVAELAAGLALAVVAARASSTCELAALAWLALFAVPLAFIDVAVRRLPDALTAAAGVGTLALLAVAALTGRQPVIWAVQRSALSRSPASTWPCPPSGLAAWAWVMPSSLPVPVLSLPGSGGRRCSLVPLLRSPWPPFTARRCWFCTGRLAPASCHSGRSS